MTDNLRVWAAKFGMTKIPLMVKPTEEAEVEQVVVRTDFVGEEDLAVPTCPL